MSILEHRTIKQRSVHTLNKYIENHPEIKIQDENKKAELGFYFLFLSYIHNLSLDQCKEIIIDTEFCRQIDNKRNDDYGVDAVYIDENAHEIFLYTFKYKHNYKDEDVQSQNPYYIASKFLEELELQLDGSYSEEKFDIYTYKTKEILAEMVSKINSTLDKFDLYLCQVTNQENPPVDVDRIRHLKERTSIITDVISYTLPQIYDLFFQNKREMNSKLVIAENYQLSYEEDSATTTKHYAISLPLIDLIRITCDKSEIRDNVDASLSMSNILDLNILYDNVRGYILKSSYNKEMLLTLDENPQKFFMYNNGITIIVEEINVTRDKLKNNLIFDLKGMQIVNGGQTLRTIYKYMDNNPENWMDKLKHANILVKIVHTSADNKISTNVARYTNSQNPISPYDLKSMDPLQITIEEFLKGHNILYIRKNGDGGRFDENKYDKEVEMVYLGQLIYSKQGNPHRASATKAQIFKKSYEDVFNRDEILKDAYELTILSYQIKEEYKNLQISFTDQKVFYIVYAYYIYDKKETIQTIIDLLEKTIEDFSTEKELSVARKLILVGFKEAFDETLRKHKLVKIQ